MKRLAFAAVASDSEVASDHPPELAEMLNLRSLPHLVQDSTRKCFAHWYTDVYLALSCSMTWP